MIARSPSGHHCIRSNTHGFLPVLLRLQRGPSGRALRIPAPLQKPLDIARTFNVSHSTIGACWLDRADSSSNQAPPPSVLPSTRKITLSYCDRALAESEPSTLASWDSQVSKPFENKSAQTISQRTANRHRWTATGPGLGSACSFSVGLWRRRSTVGLLDSQSAATILQTESRSRATDEKYHPRPYHRSAA
jgi:hypothetical protein